MNEACSFLDTSRQDAVAEKHVNNAFDNWVGAERGANPFITEHLV